MKRQASAGNKLEYDICLLTKLCGFDRVFFASLENSGGVKR
jgi:hypothetical protein